MSQQDDPKAPKGPGNAADTDLGPDDLDQISGGTMEGFIKIDNPASGSDFIGTPGVPRP